jgi:hypothetical protein
MAWEEFPHSLGPSRRFRDVGCESALPPRTDIATKNDHVGKVPILLQESKLASVRIFGETLKREPVDDSDNRLHDRHDFPHRWRLDTHRVER